MANAVRAKAVAIDMNKIFGIESSNNPAAYNKATNARGLGQITPVVLQEYNQMNKTAYTPDDLFKGDINANMSNWYVNKRIPQMLTALNMPDTIENRLVAYNAGVGNLRKVLRGQMQLPAETANYIRKYRVMGQQ